MRKDQLDDREPDGERRRLQASLPLTANFDLFFLFDRLIDDDVDDDMDRKLPVRVAPPSEKSNKCEWFLKVVKFKQFH